MVSANGSLQGLAVPLLPYLKKSQGNEVRLQRIFESSKIPRASAVSTNEEKKWFYCVPYYFESGTSLPDIVHKEKFSMDKHVDEATPNVSLGSVQKRFIVFDQSGNGTKLSYSSLLASQAPKQSLENGVLVNRCGSPQKGPEVIRDLVARHHPVLDDELNEHQSSREESEMHEDTEEIDALLYSDDSDCDDDETSTAHSPSEEDTEEVSSRFDSTKRKRLRDEVDEQSLLRDTASSSDLSEFEDGADSSYVNGRVQATPYALEGNKRAKRETIRDSVKILQNIIPDGKGKNTALTLDDAIKYLRFLKHKA
ncbi:hypothetical protein ACHQM5_016300 [Ranunculus cassubicifolius]